MIIKYVKPKIMAIELISEMEACDIIEKVGRLSHRSESKGNSIDFVKRIPVGKFHETLMEFVSATFFIRCSIGCQNELVRHRLISVNVESTRYVNYNKHSFEFIETEEIPDYVHIFNLECVNTYQRQLAEGIKPEIARRVLPKSFATSLYVRANLREWRAILKLRTNKSAHPEIRMVAYQIQNILSSNYHSLQEYFTEF